MNSRRMVAAVLTSGVLGRYPRSRDGSAVQMFDDDGDASRERKTMHKPNNLLERDVKDELDWDPTLNDSRIVVKADDGRITLTGAVDTFADVETAFMDAKTVSGV